MTNHWTKGVGTITGITIRMTHFKGEAETRRHAGRISGDATRIDWANGTNWTRLGADDADEGGIG